MGKQGLYRPEFEQLSLQHYYRGLDYLEKFKEEVEEELFSNVKTLFNVNLDLVFWDTTSTYFQGEGPELSFYGRSKDHRSDCKQVVIGVLMTKDGFPVAHQVFPGNTADCFLQERIPCFCKNSKQLSTREI